MSLATYRKKRDFGRTSEPRGREPRPARKPGSSLSFVVQKHAARRLHYDFRLELDGVLKSWAIPKGPSMNPADKRLSVETEDHPLEYGDFEGVIPEGEYGGGAVVVWDRGEWIPEGDPQRAYEKGHLTFELAGSKLHGGFHLVRTRGFGKSKNATSWLLMKRNDAAADRSSHIVDEQPNSVQSGRSLEEVAEHPGRVWHSNSSVDTAAEATRPEPAAHGGKHKPRAAARSRSSGPSRRAAAALDPPDADADADPPDTDADADVARPALRSVRLTHPERVLYPELHVTKADLALYYAQVAERMLPHVAGRPLMLVRCPSGLGQACFHQKHPTVGMSSAIKRRPVRERKGTFDALYVEDAEGLVQLVQNGALEVHVWGSRVDAIERPDQLTFDLDPGPAVAWSQLVAAAQQIRERLSALELPSFLKTTGGKGLHIVVPIAPQLEWDDAKAVCKSFAESFVRKQPDKYSATLTKSARKDKILIDYLRNGRGATAVCAYSTRAKPGAPVAMPVAWDELGPKLRSDTFTLHEVPRRLARHPDPWAEFAARRVKLTAALRRELAK